MTKPTPAMEEAQVRFHQGLALYNEGDYKLALIELQRAYDLAPTWRLLYNIGVVHYQLNNYAAALSALQGYLAGGGSEVPAKRLSEVERNIDALNARVARITVHVDVEGADVFFGEALGGTSPVKPKRLVDAGTLKVTVTKNGYQPFLQIVTLAGRDDATVDVKLQPIKSKADTLIVRDESRSYGWLLAWAGTGALATGALATGLVAVGASDDLEQSKKTRGVSPTTLADLDSRRGTFALASDILAVGAVITGGLAIYLSVKEATRTKTELPAKKGGGRPSFYFGLGSVGARAEF